MFEFSHSLGDVIKRARLEQGLTQINLAGRIAIDSRTILNIENYNRPMANFLSGIRWSKRIVPSNAVAFKGMQRGRDGSPAADLQGGAFGPEVKKCDRNKIGI